MSHASVAPSVPEPARFETDRVPDASARSGRPYVEAALLAVLAVAVRMINLDHTPHYDELFHVMAAQSWLHEGDLCIHNCGGPYDRAALFTYLVGGSFRLFGETLVAARLPSVLIGALWVAAVFLWTRHVAGRLAGWTAGLLLLVDPGAIYLSQLSRLYVPHALAFWSGAACLYVALEPVRSARSRAAFGAGAALSFAVAFHLQVTTAIGLVGVGAWVALMAAPTIIARVRASRVWQLIAVGVVLLGVLAVAVALRQGYVEAAWRSYQWTNMWPNENNPDPRHFFYFFLDQYEWMWQLLPIAALIALHRAPRPTGFLLIVFGITFVLHSVAGFKAFRVIYYDVPFFLAIWGIALSVLLPSLLRLVRTLADQLSRRPSPQRRRVAVTAVIVGLTGYALLGTELLATTRLMLTRSDLDWPPQNLPYRGFAEWRPALDVIRPLAAEADVVVVTAANKALWYLDRSDVSINENQMFDGYGRFDRDFTPDWQAGVPLIRKPESMERLLACYPTGLIVVELGHWKRRGGVPEPTAAVIERYTTPVPLAGTPDLLLFRWDRPVPIEGASCSPAPLEPDALPKRGEKAAPED